MKMTLSHVVRTPAAPVAGIGGTAALRDTMVTMTWEVDVVALIRTRGRTMGADRGAWRYMAVFRPAADMPPDFGLPAPGLGDGALRMARINWRLNRGWVPPRDGWEGDVYWYAEAEKAL